MMKLKTIIILVIIYVISFISIRYNINLLYPYYLVKDIILYPVKALSVNKDIILSGDIKDCIINSLKEDIEELKKLNNINTVLSEFNMINGTIIERNREYWFNNLTIDKGKRDGIKIDEVVINSDGLIGRISEVREYTSDIKLITTNDTKNKISVVIKDNKNNIYGITNGYDNKNNLLKVIINENININKNSFVYTTGMGGIYPSGILIGKVDSIIKASDEVTNIVLIKLSSNIKEVRYASILERKNS